MGEPLRRITSIVAATGLALVLVPGLALAPATALAHDGPHERHTWTAEEREDFEQAMEQFGKEMGRLGETLGRELSKIRVEGDWDELADLGDEIRREVERELEDADIHGHIRLEMDSADWQETRREIRELVREVAHEARFASRDAARIARDASRIARDALREHHRRHVDDEEDED